MCSSELVGSDVPGWLEFFGGEAARNFPRLFALAVGSGWSSLQQILEVDSVLLDAAPDGYPIYAEYPGRPGWIASALGEGAQRIPIA